MILDLHTHLPAPRPEAVISVSPNQLPPSEAFPGQLYSVGFHPWDIPADGLSADDLLCLRKAAERQDVVAIGECGIDMARIGDVALFSQMLAFKAQIELAEEMRLPMILHCVKAHDVILSMRKDVGAVQPWVIHGFRGKPSILQMLLQGDISVSYGSHFNPQSVAATPAESLFVDSDESSESILEIIARISQVNPAINEGVIARNVAELLL